MRMITSSFVVIILAVASTLAVTLDTVDDHFVKRYMWPFGDTVERSVYNY